MIKPSDTTAKLRFGASTAIDEEIAAVGSMFQKVFVYNISVNPAQELATLTSPDSTGNDAFSVEGVAVSRQYGILVGAAQHDTGRML